MSASARVNDHNTVVRRSPQRTRIEEPTITIPTLMKPNVTAPSCQGRGSRRFAHCEWNQPLALWVLLEYPAATHVDDKPVDFQHSGQVALLGNRLAGIHRGGAERLPVHPRPAVQFDNHLPRTGSGATMKRG